MNSTEVIYQTPNGANEKGYIINGKTYKDPQGKVRIDYGSTVPTAGGTFTYTPQGGVETYSSIANGLSKAYSDSGKSLTGYRDARNQAIDTATRRALEQINRQRKTAEENYARANQQAYRAYLNAANPYGAVAEQNARIGLSNSGYSETSKMQLAGGYQNALNENNLQRQEYLNELDNAYRDAVYKGDLEKANALAEYHQLVYQHGIDAAEAIANQKNRAYAAGIDALESQREYNASREDEFFNRAIALAKMGFSNADIAKNLGVSEGALNSYIWRNFR